MSRFEDSLWNELAERHGSLLVAAPAPTASRRPGRLAAVGLVGAAAAVAGVAAVVSAVIGGQPAYALTTNSDGSVAFVVNDITKIDEANKALADAGISARVVPFTASCTDAFTSFQGDRGSAELEASTKDNEWVFYPDRIPSGATLLLGANITKDADTDGGAVMATGTLPGCLRAGDAHRAGLNDRPQPGVGATK